MSMKKVFLIIFAISTITSIIINNHMEQNNFVKVLNDTDGNFSIYNYYIFGSHFSIEGCLNVELDGKLYLILKNGEDEVDLKSNFFTKENNTCFNVSDKINNGINLDELNKGNYMVFVKRVYQEQNTNKTMYYSLSNDTDYSSLEYYTITKNNSNNKINISFKSYEDIDYLEIKVKETKLPKDVYDITIDPGHGGIDSGAIGRMNSKEYYESSINLGVALLAKKRLESYGLKVKLTRTDDSYIESYNANGRAVIANNTKSKYCFSIHSNSSSTYLGYGGVEVYVPSNVDISLAKLIADNISELVNYSQSTSNKIDNGVYNRMFLKSDIQSVINSSIERGFEPYDIQDATPYMFMIREVGGINTFAYVDGRDSKYGLNKYYNSNNTAEPYLIELGYLNYEDDLYKLLNNQEGFANRFSDAILEYLNIS